MRVDYEATTALTRRLSGAQSRGDGFEHLRQFIDWKKLGEGVR
jgi:hypothetical protein